MTPALVIGNGESRLSINLNQFSEKYITFGCNAILRDYNVDHVVCCDRRMVTESILKIHNNIYTRKNWSDNFNNLVKALPDLPYQGDQRADDPFHWGSGPYAVLLATDFADDIHLIGFDLYGKDNLVNNVYKGTKNYAREEARAIDPSYWIYQISKVFECFPDKYFTVYNKQDWELPVSWNLSNVTFKTIDNLS